MAGLLAKASYPLVRGMISYALIWPTCSVVQEYIEHGTTLPNADWNRAARFGIFGTFFMAPVFYGWMKWSSRFFKKQSLATAVTRAAIEQVSYSPLALAYFFFGMTALEFKPFQTCVDEVKLKFWPTYKIGVVFWPVAQTLNFYFISEKNRIIFVSGASFVWTVYLAHMKAKEHGSKLDSEDVSGEMLMKKVKMSSAEGLKTAAAIEGVKTVASEGDKTTAEGLKTVASIGGEAATMEEVKTLSNEEGEAADALEAMMKVVTVTARTEDTVEGVTMIASERDATAVIDRLQEMETIIGESVEDNAVPEGIKTVVTEGVNMIVTKRGEVAAAESTTGEKVGDNVMTEGVSEGVTMIASEKDATAVIDRLQEMETIIGESVEDNAVPEGIKTVVTEGVNMIVTKRGEAAAAESTTGEKVGDNVMTEEVKTVAIEGVKLIPMQEEEVAAKGSIQKEEATIGRSEGTDAAEGDKMVASEGVKMVAAEGVKAAVTEEGVKQ